MSGKQAHALRYFRVMHTTVLLDLNWPCDSLAPPQPPFSLQLGHGGTQDCSAPVLVPALSAGSIDVEALTKAAQPVVLYSVAASDRYAVVPDSAPAEGDGGDGVGVASAAVPDAKRHKV